MHTTHAHCLLVFGVFETLIIACLACSAFTVLHFAPPQLQQQQQRQQQQQQHSNSSGNLNLNDDFTTTPTPTFPQFKMGCILSKFEGAKAKFFAWLYARVRSPRTRSFFTARHRSPYYEAPNPFPEGILPAGEPEPKILRSPQGTDERKANYRRGTVAWDQDLAKPAFKCLTPLGSAYQRSKPDLAK
ncbi:hypothetical protein ABEF95_009271 [Exophiala dermatitidis]